MSTETANTNSNKGSNIQQIKPKRKRNRPDLANFGAEKAQPGDVSKYVRAMKAGLLRPAIDTSDPEQVWKRTLEYLDYCEENDIKPQIVALSNWLKVSRDTINNWKNGQYRAGTHLDMIKQVVISLEALTVDLMLDNKVMPANVIFLLKNHYGYRDNIEITTPKSTGFDDMATAEEIADKYAKLPEYSAYSE